MRYTLKKVIAVLLAVSMLFCLTACKDKEGTTSGTSSVVADNSDVTSIDDTTSEVTSEDPASSEGTSSGENSSSKQTTPSMWKCSPHSAPIER